MRSRRQWDDLSERTRRLIILGAATEALLKVAALADIARRPTDQIRGRKAVWAAAVVLANSAGAVPLAYFRYGRRRVNRRG
ncbi:MAG: hypothetical protein ACJ74O_14395 [Frankiaceae bacterium]